MLQNGPVAGVVGARFAAIFALMCRYGGGRGLCHVCCSFALQGACVCGAFALCKFEVNSVFRPVYVPCCGLLTVPDFEANSPSPALNSVYSIDWVQRLASLPRISHPIVSSMNRPRQTNFVTGRVLQFRGRIKKAFLAMHCCRKD